ncbi:hypothetical protein [Streptomyces sp. NPDC005283]|uniref:hypothetical protein n=1 Tax=Streptomyces sp. NPDC005283 TaxID=3156871 RepID=UPI00345199C6
MPGGRRGRLLKRFRWRSTRIRIPWCGCRRETGCRFAYAVQGAGRVAGKVDGSVISYPGARESSDLELIAGSESVKETLVLKGKGAPTQWSFPLALEGLTARLDGLGGVEFVDLKGNRRAWMPPGWMEDSHLAENANEGAVSSGVGYSLTEEAGRQVLVVTLDEAWLNDPERVFPVRVDPSVSGSVRRPVPMSSTRTPRTSPVTRF